MTDLELKIYDLVRQIPEGKVATYGQIAEAAGNSKLARVVGNVMHKNPVPFVELAKKVGWNGNFAGGAGKITSAQKNPQLSEMLPVPCHRIVNGSGRMGANFGMGGPDIQARMLKEEGVLVENGRVDLKKYRYQF